MTRVLEPCLVRIWGQKRAVGAGTLITDELIVTCAHVVAQALNVSSVDSSMPDETVRLDFPLCAPGQFIQARPIAWIPVQPDESGDIAILKIEAALPTGAKPAEPIEIDDLWHIPFQTLGFPDDISASAYGTMLSRLPGGWVELEPEGTQRITAGFSGAPIFTDLRGSTESLVGIVVAKRSRNDIQIAYMLPITTIFNRLEKELVEHIRSYHLRRLAEVIYGDAIMTEQVAAFVGREAELSRLQGFLDRGLNRQLAICFVNGDPGTGKTSLVSEFTRRVQESNDKIVFAAGQCNSQSGIGDPYLPFRQILTLLTGNIDDKRLASGTLTRKNAERLRGMLQVSGQALVEIAPDLIGTLIPGASLIASLGVFTARKAGWTQVLEKRARSADSDRGDLDQTRIFEQYTALLRKLAQETPLVLVLDDLQWADTASIALLFHLSRELRDSQILIIGMYRPSEIEAKREGQPHPLAKPLNEIRIRDANVWVDLNAVTQASGRAFIDAFIDSEPNLLDKEFRQEVYQRTSGYALFTVEMLKNLQERGELVKDDSGHWYVPDTIDWGALPDKVEGVIEERIGRLEESLRDLLSVASVEGQDFTAQVVGQVQELREKDLLRVLSQELTKHHRLVLETGEKKVGKNFLYRYAFSHALFHQYLYQSLGHGQRRVLHGQVATALELLYVGRTSDIAAELALHYEEAGDTESAVKYLLILVQKTRRVGAQANILAICQRTLNLIDSLDEDYPEVLVHKASLHIWMGTAYKYLGQAERAKHHVMAGLDIAQKINNPDLAVSALVDIADLLLLENDINEATIRIQEAGSLLPQIQDQASAINLWRRWGIIEQRVTGNIELGIEYIEKSIVIAQKINDKVGLVEGFNSLGIRYRWLGQLAKAIDYYDQALVIAREQGDEFNEDTILSNKGICYRDRNELELAYNTIQTAKRIAERIGTKTGLIHRFIELGKVCLLMQRDQEAVDNFTSALDILLSVSRPSNRKAALEGMALIHLKRGDTQEALKIISETYQIYLMIDNHNTTALYGIVLSLAGDIDNARKYYQQALDYADQLLRGSENQFEPKYSRGVAFSGLALVSQGIEQERYFELAKSAFESALANCNARGAVEYIALLRLSFLQRLDKDGILTPLVTLLEKGSA